MLVFKHPVLGFVQCIFIAWRRYLFKEVFVLKSFDFEYWDSLDSKNVIITIKAETEVDAIKEFRSMHPHKKYRVLDPLDD